MAKQNVRKNAVREEVLIAAAGARCDCKGQCGQNHNWTSELRAIRCGAPHGCNIVRKTDNPSCWRLAPIQGFVEKMEGPRTHARGLYVTHGVAAGGGLAFEELFDVGRVSQVWLSMVVLDSSAKGKTVFCQFCARHLLQLRGAS